MIHPSTDAANFDGLLVFHTITFGGKKATNLVCPLLSNKKTIQFLHTAVPTCAWAFVSQLSIDYYSTAILPALSNKRSCLCKTVFCKLVCFHIVPINNLRTGIFLSLFLYYNIPMYIHPTFRLKTFRMEKAFQSWLKMDQVFNKLCVLGNLFKKCVFLHLRSIVHFFQILRHCAYSKVSKD